MVRVDRSNAGEYGIGLLLQKGVFVDVPGRCGSIRASDFICSLLDIAPNNLNRDIKTIILDGRIVDDPETTLVSLGSLVVLSGPMPGLVGAMLRSDSPYKVMRATITAGHGPGTGDNETGSPAGLVRVKLMNTVLAKYQERMVNRGFWIDGDQ